jgi:hypothetical protein
MSNGINRAVSSGKGVALSNTARCRRPVPKSEKPRDPELVRRGEHLKAIRRARGLTMDRVEEICGVRQPLLSKYEGGLQSMTVETAALLAGAYKITVGQLTGDEPLDLGSVRSVDYLVRYENAQLAAEVARREGVSSEAIDSVLAGSHDLPADAPPTLWLEAMKDEQRRRAGRRSIRGHP